MHALTDNALMLKVKSGDLDKLGLLYERHKKRLFGFFYNMNHNAALSEDMVQNVFVRMLKYKHTFTGEGSFSAWMFRAARNVSHDHFRKTTPMRNSEDIDNIDYKLCADQDQSSGMDDSISMLRNAMNKLPLEKREVLLMSKYRGLKFSEIGELLGCSEGAAKVKAHRALKDLKEIFNQLEKR